MTHYLSVAVAVLLCLVPSLLGTSATTSQGTEPLPEELRRAWEAAGFRSCWVTERSGFPRFYSSQAEGELPCFHIREWKMGLLHSLPKPTQPFAMDLMDVDVTDQLLGELAGLRKLSALYLDGRRVTENGLGSLVGLERLSSLTVIGGEITPIGVKRRAMTKSC